MHMPHFLYPFDCQQTLGPLPRPGCRERRWGGRGHAAVSEALTSVLPDVYPGNGSPGHVALILLTFPGTSTLFSLAAAPFYIPISGAQGFRFLYILVNPRYFPFSW